MRTAAGTKKTGALDTGQCVAVTDGVANISFCWEAALAYSCAAASECLRVGAVFTSVRCFLFFAGLCALFALFSLPRGSCSGVALCQARFSSCFAIVNLKS